MTTREDLFTKVVIDGITYYETKQDYTHETIIELAKEYGLRVLHRWEFSKVYDNSLPFRFNLSPRKYWTSTCADYSNYAWLFDTFGVATQVNRTKTYAAICVWG